MPRFYARKTDRIRSTSDQIQTALNLINNGHSIRSAAVTCGISRASLHRHVQRSKVVPGQPYDFTPNITNNKVFTDEQEIMLRDYLKQSSKMHYGLTNIQARKLAYQFARKLGLRYPAKWMENKMAGREWLVGFMKRAHDLSLRTPESTSLSRATNFNKYNVTEFFNKLGDILKRKRIPKENIYNIDETGITTVQRPPKIIAPKGLKQVGQVTSAERGQLVTMCNIINATGNTIPPAYVFPRVKFQEHMLRGAPPGSIGLAHKSGWMTSDNFLLVLKHFIKHSKASVNNHVLLLMDNHESHVTLEVIEEARLNGVSILTFPPHCSHRLQPLDVSVYGPFKTRYNIAMHNWMTENAGKSVTIYNVAELSCIAFNKAMNKENILSGFQKTGISEFNPEIFTDDDFLMSSVTDQPQQNLQTEDIDFPSTSGSANTSSSTAPFTLATSSSATTPFANPNIQAAQTSSNRDNRVILGETVSEQIDYKDSLHDSAATVNLRPEDVVPYPKALPRKNKTRRLKAKSRIITDTPEKENIELMKAQKRNVKKSQKLKVKKKLKCVESDTDTDVTLPDENLRDSSSDWAEVESEDEIENFNILPSEAVVGSYILCKFITNKDDVHYVGKIENKKGEVFEVNFLRRKRSSFIFYYPDVEDKYDVAQNDIVMVLPTPKINTGTARTSRSLTFRVNFETYQSTLR